MDGKTPLISIVMSVYNGSQWLKAAIDSVVQQTYSNWEFIIIDDASSDDSTEIIKSYAADKRFQLIKNNIQQGLTRNLNTGIGIAKGEYIARMDADDICLPDRFKKQVEFLSDHTEVSVVSGFVELIDENGISLGEWKDDRKANSWKLIKRMLPWKNCIAHPTVMMRNDLFKKYKYNEKQKNSQDWDLWLQLAASNIIIEKINEPLLQYRMHSQSVTAGSLKKSSSKKVFTVLLNYLDLAFRNKKLNFFNLEVLIVFELYAFVHFFSSIKRFFTS